MASWSELGRKIFYPFQLFTTWVHECAHAVSAFLLGAQSISITLAPDGSGLTRYRLKAGRLRQGIITSSGYLGATLAGCGLFFLNIRYQQGHPIISQRTLLITLSSITILSLLIWIRNGFGILVVLALGAVLASFVYFPQLFPYARFALLFLSIQTALQSLFDIRTLFAVSSKRGSDAHALAKLWILPHWFWAGTWMGMSLTSIFFTYRYALQNA
ncbi:MAG: M50 family peptidase [Proteobacteria bacterium]|nr:MAG: M50 family peptidase [Pseudomonadota bacterium]